jgi:glutamate-1-semialdehyde 2,1-aminomutase
MTNNLNQSHTHTLIPGGGHTYSKGDDQFPANAPSHIIMGRDCQVWDPEGKEYIDWGMGLRTVILGHCYPAAEMAKFAKNGPMLPPPLPGWHGPIPEEI